MFIFRFLEFAFKVVGTLFIVIFLQIPLGKKSLEEHLLTFLKGSEKAEIVKTFATDGRQVAQQKLALYLQQQIEQTRKIAQASENLNASQANSAEGSLTQTLRPIVKLFITTMTENINAIQQGKALPQQNPEPDSKADLEPQPKSAPKPEPNPETKSS